LKKLILKLLLGAGLTILFNHTVNADWTQTRGLSNVMVSSMAVCGNTLVVGTWDSGIFLSTNNGTSWIAVDSGRTFHEIKTFAVSGGTIFAGGGGVFLSTDNGASWTAVNSGLTKTVHSFAVSGIQNVFAGTDGGVFLSTNKGTSWAATDSELTDYWVLSLAVSGTNLFAGTRSQGIFRSTDNGANWTAVDSGLTDMEVPALAVSGTSIFAGTSLKGVFRSTNNGTSWTMVLNTIDRDVRALAVSGANIFAGTDGLGVFLSTNNGANWTAVNSGITDTDIRALAANDSTIFVGTEFDGVFRRPLSEMTGILDQKTQGKITHLKISTAGSTVAIEFSIPLSDQVAVTIYDLAGRAISSLVDHYLKAGSHRLFWDTHAFAKGCYAVRLQAGTSTHMLLVQIVR
jgi:photosystem II stability/assembly factor-like uncharacterized protein